MKPGVSPGAGQDGEGWGVPSVAWQHLEGDEVKVLGSGHYAVVFSATLTLPDGRRVSVALKSLIDKPFTSGSIPLEEARVLKALAGVEGVPSLYGVTASPPHVLVMSQCSGLALSVWRRRGAVRTCLEALRELCVILAKMHGRGVAHGDLHGCNILASRSARGGGASVWLIDFGHAKRNADSKAIRTDVNQLLKLLTNILMTMKEDSDGDIYRRRSKILEVTSPNWSLGEIESFVCSVLDGHSDDTACAPHP